MQNIFIDFLPPWVETGLQPAFYDKESGTVLQQTARMYAKVNQLTEAFNTFSESTTTFVNDFVEDTNTEIARFEKDVSDTVDEYIEKFNELHDYVEDYFENLDVQQEINNKLDDMVEQGTLQEIITTYIQSNVAWTFDTVADMQVAPNLIAGSYAHTLGFHSVNDGGGAFYYITDTGTADGMYVIACDTLYANLVIQDYITPEMLGAYGDNTHDDTSAVQACLSNTDYLHSVLSKDYKITSALTVPDYKVVDGGGKIHSSGTCFELDGKNHLTIRDLKLYPQLHGIHIISTSGHSNYNVFDNIFCYGADTANSKGLFIELTSSYINEFTYRNCVFWNFKYGIYALNDLGDQEMVKHTFYDCSSETSKTAGQYIKNGSGFCFYNCRHVESISNIWITEGTCDELLIVGGPVWFNNTSNMQFSDYTNGQIIGGLRYSGIGNNRSARNGNIVNGKVVPKPEALSTARINVTADMTINYGSQIYLYYNFNTAVNCTLTLPSECYGGDGKINEFFVRTSKAENTSTVVIGGVTKVLPVGTHVYRFTLNTTGGGTNWFVEDITSATS